MEKHLAVGNAVQHIFKEIPVTIFAQLQSCFCGFLALGNVDHYYPALFSVIAQDGINTNSMPGKTGQESGLTVLMISVAENDLKHGFDDRSIVIAEKGDETIPF